MPATAHRALPYPAGADVPDVPAAILALATVLDYDLHLITDAVRPAAGTLARVHRDPATGIWSLDTGAGWVTLPTGGPFLPTAGGALTGNLDLGGHDLIGAILDEHRDKVTTVAAAGAARTVDALVSPIHDVTLDQNVTFTFSGVDGDRITLAVRQPAAVKTVAWPATVDWEGGTAPAQAASTTVVYRFTRVNGRWRGIAEYGGELIPWTYRLPTFHLANPVSHINWSTSFSSGNAFGLGTNGTAQNNEVNWDVVLGAGTWQLEVWYHKGAANGIVTVTLGTIAVGTFDTYDPTSIYNSGPALFSGIVVPNSGKYRLKFKMATKNGSSSAYSGDVQEVNLLRTA